MTTVVFLKRSIILIALFFLLDFLISFVLINGLNKYYGFGKANPEVLINGSSMAMSGFNKKDIEIKTGRQIAVYALEGVSVYDRYAMIEHFFQIYPEGLKTLIYEINPLIFSNKKTAENAYTIFYPYMDNKVVAEYIKKNADNTDYYVNKIIRTKRFDPRMNRLVMMGYLNHYDNLKTNTLDSAEITKMAQDKSTVEINMEKPNMEVFESTMKLILSHNASVILVMMPMHQSKLETFRAENYSELCSYFENICSLNANVKFLDLNRDSLILNSAYFSDPLHFNVYGQRQITNLISTYLLDQ